MHIRVALAVAVLTLPVAAGIAAANEGQPSENACSIAHFDKSFGDYASTVKGANSGGAPHTGGYGYASADRNCSPN